MRSPLRSRKPWEGRVPTVRTLNDIYRVALSERAKPDAFRTKRDGDYQDVSSADFSRAGHEIALGLIALGLETGQKVALLSPTRLEWAQCDMGILLAGLISVPIYPTLTESTVEYVLTDSGADAVFVADDEQAAKVAVFRSRHPDLPMIQFDGGGQGSMTLDALRERGRELGAKNPELAEQRGASVGPDDVATLIYTSGTTGMPKGVMLTHHNIVANVLGSLEALPIHKDDTCLSFLPLSHILERMAGLYVMVWSGVTIGYAESIDTVPQNLQEVRPTIMISVPRLYEKMYARILDAARQGGPVKKNLFHWARKTGLRHARQVLAGSKPGPWLDLQVAVARKLVFSKLQARTGGRLRFFVSGGAPLSKEIAEFFYVAGIPILEGYGLTESSPVIAVNTPTHLRMGTVGKPVPGVQVRIAEDGEILAKGPNIMKGYYNLPEETAAVLKDGWLYTGDIGHLDADGYLVITDRKKDLLVTAGGKNVAPQPIENALKTDRYISMAVVLGDRRPCLAALIVPDLEQIERYARDEGIAFTSATDLVKHPAIHDLIRRRIVWYQRDAARFEQIKEFHLLDHELTIEDGELTPTLKVKRKVVTERYAKEIEAMYRDDA